MDAIPLAYEGEGTNVGFMGAWIQELIGSPCPWNLMEDEELRAELARYCLQEAMRDSDSRLHSIQLLGKRVRTHKQRVETLVAQLS